MSKPCKTERCFAIEDLLFRRVMDGLSNKEIADATGYAAVHVCRDLQLLESMGRVERRNGDRWVLTIRPLANARAYQLNMADMQRRGEELENRINARAAQMMP